MKHRFFCPGSKLLLNCETRSSMQIVGNCCPGVKLALIACKETIDRKCEYYINLQTKLCPNSRVDLLQRTQSTRTIKEAGLCGLCRSLRLNHNDLQRISMMGVTSSSRPYCRYLATELKLDTARKFECPSVFERAQH